MFSFFASKITETGGIKPRFHAIRFRYFPWTALQDGRRSFCTLILIISHSKKAACMGGFFAVYLYFFQYLLQQRRAS